MVSKLGQAIRFSEGSVRPMGRPAAGVIGMKLRLVFWTVAMAQALILLAPNVSILFMYSYMTSKGLGPAAAAGAVSAVSAMQVVSRVAFWLPVLGIIL